jgi:hypothetical protein
MKKPGFKPSVTSKHCAFLAVFSKILKLNGTYFCVMHNKTTDDSVIAGALKEMSPEQRSKYIQTLKGSICLECGSITFRQIDGEIVCTGCGLVRSRSLQYLGTNDYSETSSPVINLAFGRGLGNTLGSRRGLPGKKDLFRVLTKAPAGKEDIWLRIRQMSIMSTLNEDPITHRLLEVGAKLSREFGMEGEGDYVLLFADHFGTLLQNVGVSAWLMKTPAESVRTKALAVATFAYVYQLMERDKGRRKEIEYEPYFPGHNRKAFTRVEPKKYKVDRQDWDFVCFEYNRRALWTEWVNHQRLKSEGELIADVRPDDGIVESSAFLVDGHVSEGVTRKKRTPKCMKGIPCPGSRVSRENLTEYERQLLEVFGEEEGGDVPVRKPTVKMTSVTLRRGTLANVLSAISSLEQVDREVVAEEQVRASVDRLDLPSKSAKKRRRREGKHRYDLSAFLISVLRIKAGDTADLFIGSVILRRLLEVYKSPARLSAMPWATRRPYGIVIRTLQRLPLKLKST